MTKLFKQTLQYSNSGHADWIRDIEWHSIPIRKIAGIEGKKQAGYCPVANTIELADDADFSVLFGSYIHELWHVRQRRKFGLLLYWLFLGLFRPLMEKRAKQEELAAVEWSNNVRIQKWREAKLNERSRTN